MRKPEITTETTTINQSSTDVPSGNTEASNLPNRPYSTTNKILYALSTIAPATIISASAAMIAGSNANKEYNYGYEQGRDTGIAFEKNGGNFHDLRAKGSAAIACSPLFPPLANSVTAFFTLEAAWFLAWKAGHTGDNRFLLSALGVLIGGTGLITLENIATLTGCTELNGFLTGLEKGFDYACIQNATSPDCKDAVNVTDPNEGLHSFSGISSLATTITSPIVAGVGLLGGFFSYASGRIRKNEEQLGERQPLLLKP